MAERSRVRVALVGATGRMGRAIAALAADDARGEIVAAIASPSSAHLGTDLGQLATGRATGVAIGSDLEPALRTCDVVVDFSRADSVEAHLDACRRARKPLLVGTTGLATSLDRTLDAAAREIALLVAPNTSLGVAVLLELAARAAAALPAEFDAEIAEAHHRHKRDAPSGTALALGEAVARARGSTLAERRAPSREGARVRREGEIGFAVVRAGEIVGEHEVRFAGAGEELTLAHRATDRRVFASGALRAAAWLASQPAGRYTMRDVLSGKSTT